jgi:signal transduction histidine kinase/DNA-binding response OmpR family regulator
VEARGEVETLKDTMNQMIANLRVTTQKDADQVWLKTNLARFTLMLQGQTDLQTVSAAILTELSKVVTAQHGVFYIADASEGRETRLKLLSAFAYQPRPGLAREFALGEGLVGQCARDKESILVADPPDDYIKISSGLGEQRPANILVLPILFENRMKAVLELASFSRFSPTHMAFLEQLMEGIGIVLNTLEAGLRTETLLKSLQIQQEELRKTNQALEDKADQLALTSKYKSEFLSNMSHELRTPLNSMLILSQQLAEDPKNLTDKQVEYAKTIHASGGDLLTLINDILDLAKVESGTLALEMEDLPLEELRRHLERVFLPLAEGKGVSFSIDYDAGKLDRIHTDGQRLEQILRNLISNAFKFTEKGRVSLKIETVQGGWSPDHAVLSKAESVIAFTVVDTGIGIPVDKQKIIFEAFQQADSGTSRKYGGTGLGLSISRELARLLGAQLSLSSSTPGKGSTFVLYVSNAFMPQAGDGKAGDPEVFSGPKNHRSAEFPSLKEREAPAPLADDRAAVKPGEPVLLIVEDDRPFAAIVLGAARQRGFKCLVAHDGAGAIKLVEAFKPGAVVLDIHLPDMDGWGVLSNIKSNPASRHIPVQIISVDEDRRGGIKQGAIAFLPKPVDGKDLGRALDKLLAFQSRAVRNLLLLCDEPRRAIELKALLEGDDVRLSLAKSAREASLAVRGAHFDCMVMDAPGAENRELLLSLKKDTVLALLPIVVFRTGEFPEADEALFREASRYGVVKEARSQERLLDETALYLHRSLAGMAPEKNLMIRKLYGEAPTLSKKKVLVVDDDIRNIFAMTSLLENAGMVVLSAESGLAALELLKGNADTDVVLMDIMMPEMDGHAAMRAIRKDPRFQALPIIALTAKAMKGDREKCIESGASDYITKPVDTGRMLSMLRLWLHR